MKVNKLRHNPYKPQNNRIYPCPRYEEHYGTYYCEGGYGEASICKGNPHNCVKTFYHRAASRSNKQINDGVFSRR